LVRVDSVSKKFCRSLKKSLWYGVCDIAGELLPGRKRQRVAGSELLVASGNTSAEGASGPAASYPPLVTSPTGEASLRDGEFWAVQDVSFELRRGECLGLIGHNGAGKTTLLKMLNGLIKPDRGTITMRGRVGALIALGAGFNPILTGRENIYINGSVLGLTKKEIDAKIDEIIDFAEIREFIDMPVQSYSSGMSVRLGFAIAGNLEPDILILDEVLAVGDVSFRSKCYHLVSKILSKTAVIFVSHNINHINNICNRCIYLNRGSIKEKNSVELSIEKYVEDAKIFYNQSGINKVYYPIKNANIVLPETINAGESLSVEFLINSESQCLNVYIQIAIHAKNGDLIADWCSRRRGLELNLEKNYSKKTIILEKIYLKSGKYPLIILIRDQNKKLLFHSQNQYILNVNGYNTGANIHLTEKSIWDNLEMASRNTK
jgi:lipopolysaccharide transport system ATP-binding protein